MQRIKKSNFAPLLLFLAFLLPLVSMAQVDGSEAPEKLSLKKERHDHERLAPADREKWKAAKEELRAYDKQYVKPVLKAKRMAFDQQLAAEDKLEIEALRNELKAIKKAHQAKAKTDKQEMQKQGLKLSDDSRPRGGKKGKGHGKKGRAGQGKLLENNPELAERANLLVNKYDRSLTMVERELASNRSQWEADKEAILAKHLDATTLEKVAQKKEARKMEKNREFAKVGFLLMDPNKKEHPKKKGHPKK